MTASFRRHGNPFLSDDMEFLAIHTKDMMNDKVIHTVRYVQDIGKKQF